MAELTPCEDCQHQISKSARSCPKCKSSEPHGVNCLVCKDDGGRRLSVKAAHRHPHYRADWGYSYYHPTCIERVLAIPDESFCPECAVKLSGSWNWEELCSNGHVTCKNCGVLNVFRLKGNCAKCQLPILDFHAMRDTGSTYSPSKYHESCFHSVQRLAAQTPQVEDPQKREDRIVKQATLVGAIACSLLAMTISSVVTLSGLTEHQLPVVAIMAFGVVGALVGAIVAVFITAVILSL
jgi:hypothetical protein